MKSHVLSTRWFVLFGSTKLKLTCHPTYLSTEQLNTTVSPTFFVLCFGFFWSSFCSGFGNPCYVSNWMHCLEEKDWSLFNHTSIFYKLVFSMKCSTETALVNLYLCHSVLTLFLFSLHNDVPLFFNIECICIKMCCVLIY